MMRPLVTCALQARAGVSCAHLGRGGRAAATSPSGAAIDCSSRHLIDGADQFYTPLSSSRQRRLGYEQQCSMLCY